MRADRLVALVLLLQARGRMTAGALARELEVSIRTVYRDLEALGAAGVPVTAESGPRGGCELVADYRFPLRGLRAEEAEALLMVGVPAVLSELGLGDALDAALRRVRLVAGAPDRGSAPLVHLDMPGWFRSAERLPALPALADALRRGLAARIAHRVENGVARVRRVAPLGLVNKAGVWYLIAAAPRILCFRVARIDSARVLADAAERPAGFDLVEFWRRWSADFAATRPRLAVQLRVSPGVQSVLIEIFGDGAGEALESASPPDALGWRVLTLHFEHELAAATRLAGLGGGVEVLDPPAVRERLRATARAILDRYRAPLEAPARGTWIDSE